MLIRTTALGIGGERRKELCAVERSTEANAEPRKARPPLPRSVKNSWLFFTLLGSGGNAQNNIIKHTLLNKMCTLQHHIAPLFIF